MTEDLAPILEGWDHAPNDIIARRVEGLDGGPKVQMRLELGLIQMEWDGRPDGQRPHGHESSLHHLQEQARLHEATHTPDESFKLDTAMCAELQHEGIQYYYRYLCMLHLGEYGEAERDTARNLRLFEFVRTHAPSSEVAWAFDQYRPFVAMMNIRARASLCLENQNPKAALGHIRQGIGWIKKFLADYPEVSAGDCHELAFLQGWADEIRDLGSALAPTATPEEQRLEAELAEAVATENYEQAARIRDALERLRGE